jgi:predicted membrane-bound spermidine synthase
MNYLSLLVFSAGAVTLGVELSAARLLDPWFGNSQIVWAGLIGLILLYLSVGSWLGGKLADRFPSLVALLILGIVAGLGVALIPAVSPPILRLAAQGVASFAPGLLAGTLLAVLLLFSFPVILLGAVTPWAVRLAITDLRHTGATAGRLSAVATAGSILGTFLPVLWLIPTFGTRWTFYLLSLALLLVAGSGFLVVGASRRLLALPVAALILVLVLAFATNTASVYGNVDDGLGAVIYEDETRYNYISVRQWGSERHLKLNEGVGVHSVHHPDMLMSQGIWDYFLLAPLFRTETPIPTVADEVLIIGLAAGTVAELYSNIYGPIPIIGVELDPTIIEVGRTYFQMDQPNLTAIAADGRRWLQQQPPERQFDLILIDAYRPPYIPFHLTTVEYFQLVRNHLREDGVVAINVGRTDRDFALVEAMTATLHQVFPSVVIVDEPGPPHQLANSLIIATVQPSSVETFARHVATLPADLPSEFRQFSVESIARARSGQLNAEAAIFTDDRAPVEQVVHGIIWDFLTAGE